jgi:lysozyme
VEERMNPANAALKYSKSGLQLTEMFEGVKLTAYRCPAGILTIGYGHTGHDVYEGLTITQDHAEALLLVDITWAEVIVKHYVTVALTQTQFNSLVDFVFNIGSGNFEHSTLLKVLNTGDFVQAGHEFEKWEMIHGTPNKGLARRRVAEAELFAHGIIKAAA